MSESYYSKKTATDMALEALEIYKQSDIDARFGVDICIDPNKDTGSEYYLCVTVRDLEKETYDHFYPRSNDLSEVRAAVEAIREKQHAQPKETDTEFIKRMFPNAYNPMEDIDRLLDMVKEWKGGGDE